MNSHAKHEERRHRGVHSPASPRHHAHVIDASPSARRGSQQTIQMSRFSVHLPHRYFCRPQPPSVETLATPLLQAASLISSEQSFDHTASSPHNPGDAAVPYDILKTVRNASRYDPQRCLVSSLGRRPLSHVESIMMCVP
ncbi:hypothetical protein E2C01_028032 [Portunus trituberculatus]|uniref:Uncharacterized protein n=1 Tax=Portunus trituberculatus TaxID=210409 RepID=A0A5B7EN51_PORTR|nr:hypothetical protein [Portunus trituberculatus]